MTPFERQKLREEEELIAKEIMKNGQKVGLSWYLYEGEYYQIFNNTVRYARQKSLKINSHEGWFVLDLENSNACVIYIDGFEKVLNGVDVNTVVIYPDKYFMFRSLSGVWELWRHDAHILSADTITRLTDVLWSLSSNGIYYISNLNDRFTRPVSKFPLQVDDRSVFFVDEVGVRQDVTIF